MDIHRWRVRFIKPYPVSSTTDYNYFYSVAFYPPKPALMNSVFSPLAETPEDRSVRVGSALKLALGLNNPASQAAMKNHRSWLGTHPPSRRLQRTSGKEGSGA